MESFTSCPVFCTSALFHWTKTTCYGLLLVVAGPVTTFIMIKACKEQFHAEDPPDFRCLTARLRCRYSAPENIAVACYLCARKLLMHHLFNDNVRVFPQKSFELDMSIECVPPLCEMNKGRQLWLRILASGEGFLLPAQCVYAQLVIDDSEHLRRKCNASLNGRWRGENFMYFVLGQKNLCIARWWWKWKPGSRAND